jgi:hypothetical protein
VAQVVERLPSPEFKPSTTRKKKLSWIKEVHSEKCLLSERSPVASTLMSMTLLIASVTGPFHPVFIDRIAPAPILNLELSFSALSLLTFHFSVF